MHRIIDSADMIEDAGFYTFGSMEGVLTSETQPQQPEEASSGGKEQALVPLFYFFPRPCSILAPFMDITRFCVYL